MTRAGCLISSTLFSAPALICGDLDLSYFLNGPIPDTSSDPSTNGCSLAACGAPGNTLTVTSSSTATVTNDVVAHAGTGGNSAAGVNASITTGDAAASANVVNVVNTNIVDSHYLLVALNNFGDLAGDITLPGADFFSQLFASHESLLSGRSTVVTNTNVATVTGSTTSTADTGDNTASSTAGDANVTTGDALAGATTVNQVNTNLTNGTKVFILLNVIGNWTGGIKSLPAGLSWAQTPGGIAITGDSSALSSLTAPLASNLTVTNTSTASVTNNVNVWALTGDNQSNATNGTASVSTGSAYASANVVNVVNTNILGENWMLAIFNIFGNWNGNLSFGHPDLWTGTVAEAGTPIHFGDNVTYHFTIANHGDADATNVVLHAGFNTALLSFAHPDATSTEGDSWNLGTIPAGGSRDFSFTATTGVVRGNSQAPVPLTATVTESETDANTADNTDTVTILDGVKGADFLAPEVRTGMPVLKMTKTASVSTSTIPASIDYRVAVENVGSGPAYATNLEDMLKGPTGETVADNSWELDTIDVGDEVDVTYSVVYNASSTPGTYTNTATLSGQEGSPDSSLSHAFDPIDATASVKSVARPGARRKYEHATRGKVPATHHLVPGTGDEEQRRAGQETTNVSR